MHSGWIDCPTDVAEILRSIDLFIAIRRGQHYVGMPELNEVIQCRLDIGAFCPDGWDRDEIDRGKLVCDGSHDEHPFSNSSVGERGSLPVDSYHRGLEID